MAHEATSDPQPNPGQSLGLGARVLDRARGVARSIGIRVRDALRAAGAAPPPLRVLVVDDSPDAADSLAAVLELLGFDVRVSYDGFSARSVVREFTPDACLIDLVMPGLDGLELAAALRAWVGTRPLLLVATTALGAVEDRTRTALAGFHYHLVKPVDAPALVEALTRFGGVLGRRESPPDPLQSDAPLRPEWGV
jgi:CheY-like chemotaxis protein